MKLSSIIMEEPESGPGAVFGKYAFDDYRTDIEPSDREPMSHDETYLANIIRAYIVGNRQENLRTVAPVLLKLVRAGMYRPVLDPGSQDVYRGMVLQYFNYDELFRLFPKLKDAETNVPGEMADGIYSPLESKISGWSTEKAVLQQFLGPANKFAGYVSFQANPSKNPGAFFGKPASLAVAVNTPDRQEEHETISFGDVQYDRCRFFLPNAEARMQDRQQISKILKWVAFETDSWQ